MHSLFNEKEPNLLFPAQSSGFINQRFLSRGMSWYCINAFSAKPVDLDGIMCNHVQCDYPGIVTHVSSGQVEANGG